MILPSRKYRRLLVLDVTQLHRLISKPAIRNFTIRKRVQMLKIPFDTFGILSSGQMSPIRE